MSAGNPDWKPSARGRVCRLGSGEYVSGGFPAQKKMGTRLFLVRLKHPFATLQL
jgi:hypothetical protein